MQINHSDVKHEAANEVVELHGHALHQSHKPARHNEVVCEVQLIRSHCNYYYIEAKVHGKPASEATLNSLFCLGMPKATSKFPSYKTRCSIPDGEENQSSKAENSEIRIEKSPVKINKRNSRRESNPHEQLNMGHN